MERNLLASLARGEVVPGRRELEQVGPPQEPLYNNRGDDGKSRVRTLSAVNEHLLAQLSMQERATAPNNSNSNNRGHASQHHQLHSPSSPIQGRPPLPSRPPQPQPKLTTVPACSNNGSTSSHNINGNGSNGNHIPPFHAMDSLELSPDPTEAKKGPATDSDKLRGID